MATYIQNVVVFGDSVAGGFGIPDRTSWVTMLADHYYQMNERNPHARFSDLSYVGDGSARLLRRVEHELPERVRPGRPHLSIVALGAQDILEMLSEYGLPDRFFHPTPQRIMEHMIPAAKMLGRYGMTLAIGPAKCNANLAGLYGHPELGGGGSLYQGLRWANRAIREGFDVAAAPDDAELRFSYVNVLDKSTRDPEFSLGRDGIHPDEQGQRWLFKQIVPFFDSLVQLRPSVCPPLDKSD
jgi:lysophospholipase L1-like esterase